MRILSAVLLMLMSAMIPLSDGQKRPIECCTSVSTMNITLPITGFKLQKSSPPCVNAVIFFTAEGPRCSHWKEGWVKEKIQELKKLQLQERQKINSTSSTPPPRNSPPLTPRPSPRNTPPLTPRPSPRNTPPLTPRPSPRNTPPLTPPSTPFTVTPLH